MDCPELEELEQHFNRAGAGESHGPIAGHLETCPTCAARAEEISQNLGMIDGLKEALRDEEQSEAIAPPERIGPYRILREIARGGMGVVYLAEQERPTRKVALKVLRPGVASAETLRRFELEADLLARLRHPGIATIFEAGLTELRSGGGSDRVPYIAMEHVQGERLDRYVTSRGIPLRERLALVAEVADAVHHAHLKGLVHRDLKPGNILVELRPSEGGAPVAAPKILDFGVARVAVREAGRSSHTSTGQLLGTVPYMSPEQLGGDPSSVDARSDVYALGVVAYEILTGRFPYDAKEASLAEAARMIRDDDPRPPGRIDSRLHGDVETILLKALEKDPARRYASAAELAAEIRRYLRHEPIQARPQGAAYQIRRFAQRNRGFAFALSVLAVTLVTAAGLGSLLAFRAARAERLAQLQLEEARRQAEKFAAVNRFLEEMLSSASPESNPGGGDLTVLDALHAGIAELDGKALGSQPAIEMGIRTTIGNTYRALGEYREARDQLERAVALGRELHPGGHEDLAYAINKLGRTVQELGDQERAEALFRECLGMYRRLLGLRSGEAATAMNNLAQVLSNRGDKQEALEMFRESLAIRREIHGESHEEIANSLNNLAVLRHSMGNREEAAALLSESLEMDIGLRGELHPNVALTMNNLAMVNEELGRLEEAEQLHRRALELGRRVYGGTHPKLANSLLNLARLLVRRERLDEAEPLYKEALAVEREARGQEHPAVANLLGNYAGLFEARGNFDRAEELHRQALAIRLSTLGEDAVPTLGSRYNLARVARERGDLRRAVEAFERVAEDARRILPRGSGHRFTILAAYGLCLADSGRGEEAAQVLREALAEGSATLDESHPRIQEVATALAALDTAS